jgi:hypothetical protein
MCLLAWLLSASSPTDINPGMGKDAKISQTRKKEGCREAVRAVYLPVPPCRAHTAWKAKITAYMKGSFDPMPINVSPIDGSYLIDSINYQRISYPRQVDFFPCYPHQKHQPQGIPARPP